MKNLIIVLFFFCYFQSSAQTQEEWEMMKKEINTPETEKIKKYITWRANEFKRLSTKNKWSKFKTEPDGDTLILIDFDADEQPIYAPRPEPLSNPSVRVRLTKADAFRQGGSLGVNIEGQGMLMAQWEANDNGYYAQAEHVDFRKPSDPTKSRVGLSPNIPGLIDYETTPTYSFHATVVAGYPIGSAEYQSGKREGISPKASLLSYQAHGERSIEFKALFDHPTYGYCLASNNSYVSGSVTPVRPLTGYNSVDLALKLNKYHTSMIAKGNWYLNAFGFMSKNAISVGAVDHNDSMCVVLPSAYETWYRIYPHVMTNTEGYVASYNRARPDKIDSYFRNGGCPSSSSTPQVTGGVLLLQQLYRDYNPTYMTSNSVRALIVHSATDMGAPGPDLEFGYGKLDLEKAGRIIQEDQSKALILESALDNEYNTSFERRISTDSSGSDFEVTLAWDDVRGSVSSQRLIDPTKEDFLINDLDLRIYDEQGNVQNLPYTLNGVPPHELGAATVLGDNDKDNYEKILIQNPKPNSVYTIKVTIKNPVRYRKVVNNNNLPLLEGGEQAFSLIISGITACTEDLEVSDPITSPTTYHVGNTLTCSSKISGSNLEDVALLAGNNVHLVSGFHASNLVTHATLEPCYGDDQSGKTTANRRYNPVEREITYFDIIPSNKEPSITENDDLKVYPNPTSANLTFELSAATSGKYEVRDLLGRLVLQESFDDQSTVTVLIEDKNLAPDAYFLLVSTPSKNYVRKFVVK